MSASQRIRKQKASEKNPQRSTGLKSCDLGGWTQDFLRLRNGNAVTTIKTTYYSCFDSWLEKTASWQQMPRKCRVQPPANVKLTGNPSLPSVEGELPGS